MQPRMKRKINALLKYCKTKLKPKTKTEKMITNSIHKVQHTKPIQASDAKSNY